jgi:Protein of unknown function (DUF2950)
MRTCFALRHLAVIALTCALPTLGGCRSASTPQYRTFAAPEDAVRALIGAVKAGQVDEVVRIFGPEGKELIDTSDPATARRNREVFTAAATERWRLVDRDGGGKVLVVGNEEWPFPVPLVKESNGWRFDAAAGREEVISRRIGRNELSAIQACRTYVAAQRLYARQGHDGRPPGLYAAKFRSDPGRQNGLYWPVVRGAKRSPLGDLLAEAADVKGPHDRDDSRPAPFHGYRFRILTAQGDSAGGGPKSYIVNGDLTNGFALVAWPAHYDVSGVMTFLINQDGIVYEKDLGTGTDTAARAITRYDPDASWAAVR